jgi:hypothetical protein
VEYNCPADQEVVDCGERYFKDLPANEKYRWIPCDIFISDRHGVARMLSLPSNTDEFHSKYIANCRVSQSVLHNLKIDKRKTKRVLHIVESE